MFLKLFLIYTLGHQTYIDIFNKHYLLLFFYCFWSWGCCNSCNRYHNNNIQAYPCGTWVNTQNKSDILFFLENVKPCPALPIISHGIVTDVPKAIFQHGDRLEVQCEISFALYGSKTIECVDGEWAPLPSCKGKQQLLERCLHKKKYEQTDL